MSDSLRRQRRLLYVRSLQADFAAAELRRSQIDASQAAEQLQHARSIARPELNKILDVLSDPVQWTLSCAEQELAAMEVDRQEDSLQVIHTRIVEQQLHEAQARGAREQMKRVCERQQEAVDYIASIREQSTLDDLFNASLIRDRNIQTGKTAG